MAELSKRQQVKEIKERQSAANNRIKNNQAEMRKQRAFEEKNINFIFYSYVGVNILNGKKVKGVLGARDETDAIKRLKMKSIKVSHIEIKDDPWKINKYIYHSVQKEPRPRELQQAEFFDQLAFLISAGLSMVPALENVMECSADPRMKIQASLIIDQVKQGSALDTAMETTGFYSRSIIAQITAGLESNDTVGTLHRLSESLINEVKLRKKIMSALRYPVGVIIVTIAIIWGMTVFIIPGMENSITKMGGTMPELTLVVLTISHMFQNYGVIALAILGALGYLGYKHYSTHMAVKFKVDRWLLTIPIAGRLMLKTDLVRFCRGFASLQACNIDTAKSLGIMSESLANEYLRTGCIEAQSEVELNGSNLLEALGTSNKFPYDMLSLIGIGVDSGDLISTCTKIADRYDQEIEDLTKKITDILPMIATLLVGLVVGVIVISMYLPMFNMLDSI